MKCPKCGTETVSKFCENCGSPMSEADVYSQSAPQQYATVPPMPVKPKKPIFKQWWFWAIIAVVVIGIIGNLGGKNSDKDTDSNTISKLTSNSIASTSKADTSINTTNESKTNTTNSTTSNTTKIGVTPQFKEAMDSYEKFFDEYVTFMKKYQNSDDAVGMLTDYTKYMTKYADTMDKMSKIDEDNLSTADSVYYIEVNSRITKKLLEVAQ